MKRSHENSRVREPVQVYLDRQQRRRLEELALELGLSKADVVRRGLEVLEQQMEDPAQHPALRIIGIADGKGMRRLDFDVAVQHDRYLAESEQKSWKVSSRRKRGS